MLETLGGYRHVALRVGMASTTMHSHMMANVLPAKFYFAFRALAVERGSVAPDPALFGFVSLRAAPPHTHERDAA